MTPRYQHDCVKCTFLGCYSNSGPMQFDLYHCEQGALPTIIARYGDDGPAYLSGTNRLIDVFDEGVQRATDRGLSCGK